MHFRRWISGGLVLALAVLLVACTPRQESYQQFSFSGPTMGTTFNVSLVDSSFGPDINTWLPQQVDSVLRAVNAAMSTYQQNSEISEFNRWKSRDGFGISAAFDSVMSFGLELCARSGGAFDVTVAPFVNFYGFGFETGANRFPTVEEIDAWLDLTGCQRVQLADGRLWKENPDVSIDLSAVAKGFGADKVRDYLRSRGYTNVFIEVGGEISVSGHNAWGQPWRIGVDRPSLASVPGESLQHVLHVSSGGVATSGDYRNYREIEGRRITHMIDPRTGYPITHQLASVTIIAENCMIADGLATATMVMGVEEGLAWLEQYGEVEGLLITRDGEGNFQEYMTAGFASYLDR